MSGRLRLQNFGVLSCFVQLLDRNLFHHDLDQFQIREESSRISLGRAAYYIMTPHLYRKAHQLLSLPLELRIMIYKFSLAESDGKVIIVSNYFEGQRPPKIKFYTIKDLSLLETNKQIRTEASEVFYAMNIFTLNSYPRKREGYLERPLYGENHFRIDFRRVRKAHVLTPKGFFPRSDDDCVLGMKRMQYLLEGLQEALSGEHSMQCLLIEAYEFEHAVVGESFTMASDLSEALKPLESVRGIQVCHIRSMKQCTWPYLRLLEKTMSKSCTYPGHFTSLQRVIRDSAAMYQEKMMGIDTLVPFSDANPQCVHKLFEEYKIEPLYTDISILRRLENNYSEPMRPGLPA